MLTAPELLDDALATLVEGCDAVDLAPEEWRSPIVGPFDPDSTEGWIGKLDAGDERPPSDPRRYYYALILRGPAVRDVDAAAEQYGLARLAGGWAPFSDFTVGEGKAKERTIYFQRDDGARTGLVLTPRGTTQTFDSATTEDPDVMTPGAGIAVGGPDDEPPNGGGNGGSMDGAFDGEWPDGETPDEGEYVAWRGA